MVEECSCDALEWGRLLELVGSFASSAVAREWLLAMKPSRDTSWIDQQHDLVSEMRLLLGQGVSPAQVDCSTQLADGQGAMRSLLEPEDIRNLLFLVDNITTWQELIERPPETVATQLRTMTEPVARGRTTSLARSLRSRLNPDGSLSDDASPDLRRIRREMERQQRVIEESLRSTLRRLSEGGSTQEDLITIRGERFVIPVKSGCWWHSRGRLLQRQTVYLSPWTTQQNNELVRLIEEEQAETIRIFMAMTREIGQQSHAIAQGAATLAQVDGLQARGRFAAEFACVRPRFADPSAPLLVVKQARLLQLEKRLRAAGDGNPADPGSEYQELLAGLNTGAARDGGAQDDRFAGHDGTGRDPGASRRGGLSPVRRFFGGHRRRAVDRAKPFYLFRPHHQSGAHLEAGGFVFPGFAG